MTQRKAETGMLTRPVARFVAIGLFLMAFFTVLWASWSLHGFPPVIASAFLVIFAAFAVVFVINGVQFGHCMGRGRNLADRNGHPSGTVGGVAGCPCYSLRHGGVRGLHAQGQADDCDVTSRRHLSALRAARPRDPF
jgi:hypothetical protein